MKNAKNEVQLPGVLFKFLKNKYTVNKMTKSGKQMLIARFFQKIILFFSNKIFKRGKLYPQKAGP